jgi:hypothetical protein
MIQFRRGGTRRWRATKIRLTPGQPGYDKDKHKIKIGDGEKLWSELPYASGLFAEEILSSEIDAAKNRDPDDKFAANIITYGLEPPKEGTIGQIYLQQYDAEPEVDYVIEAGIDGIWTYQKWKSGIAKCWGTYSLSASIQEPFESEVLFYGSGGGRVSYPFTFTSTPTETATLQSSGGLAWLASSRANTKSTSGSYTIISPDAKTTTAAYSISMQVEGLWR